MPFTQAELEERRRFLGASEAPAAIGLSPFFTPVDLYKDKIGEGEPIEESLPMLVGQALEPVTITAFMRKTGLTVSDRQRPLVDERHPWRRCTLDGRASDGWLLEAKSSGQWQNWGKEIDAVPAPIIYQCQHQLACDLDAPGVYVPVILGQREFRLYQVERNPELIELLTEQELQFMRHVNARIPPPPTTHDDLKLLYPVDLRASITATDYINGVAHELARTKAQLKELLKQEESQSFEIKEFMKDAALLLDAKGKPLYTWSSHTERRMDVTAFRKDHARLAEEYSQPSVVRKLLNKIKL